MKLVLGVIDVPYTEERISTGKVAPAKKGKAAKPIKPKAQSAQGDAETTGEVALKLEETYGVMQVFVNMHKADIEAELHKSFSGAIVNLNIGGPATPPFAGACDKIAEDFRQFLDTEEIAGAGVPGVPTAAAKRGVNHRLKLERGPRRPSFVDTGLYQNAMKVWVE